MIVPDEIQLIRADGTLINAIYASTQPGFGTGGVYWSPKPTLESTDVDYGNFLQYVCLKFHREFASVEFVEDISCDYVLGKTISMMVVSVDGIFYHDVFIREWTIAESVLGGVSYERTLMKACVTGKFISAPPLSP